MPDSKTAALPEIEILTTYRTSDGRTFSTLNEAKEHQKGLKVLPLIEKLGLCFNSGVYVKEDDEYDVPATAMLEWIRENKKELREILSVI